MEAHLKVVLVSYSPEPEKTSAAARLCYSPADGEEILSEVVKNNQGDFLEKLTAVGHLSPVEHASFTFVVEGISRAMFPPACPAPSRIQQPTVPAIRERGRIRLHHTPINQRRREVEGPF